MHGRERSLLYTCFKEAYKLGEHPERNKDLGEDQLKEICLSYATAKSLGDKRYDSRFRHIYRALDLIQQRQSFAPRDLTAQKAWQAPPSLPCNDSLRRTGPGNRIRKALPGRALFYLDAYLTPSRTLPRIARRTDADSTHITSTASLSR